MPSSPRTITRATRWDRRPRPVLAARTTRPDALGIPRPRSGASYTARHAPSRMPCARRRGCPRPSPGAAERKEASRAHRHPRPAGRRVVNGPRRGKPPDHGTGTALSSDPGTSSVAPATPSDAAGAVTLAFGGDIHFEEYLRPLAGDPEGLAALKPLWAPLTCGWRIWRRRSPSEARRSAKEFHFRTPASRVDHARQRRPDRPHDRGQQPRRRLRTRRPQRHLAARASSPIPIVGIGTDESDAHAPALLTVGGLKIAVFGADQVYEMTLVNYSAGATKAGSRVHARHRIVKAVTAIRDEVDLVVVYLHWGLDYPGTARTASRSRPPGPGSNRSGRHRRAHSHRVNGAGWLKGPPPCRLRPRQFRVVGSVGTRQPNRHPHP